MEAVQDAVEDRREQDPRGENEQQAGVERVATGEDLATERHWIVDGAHPAEQHRGIEECVGGSQVLEEVVTRHPEQE